MLCYSVSRLIANEALIFEAYAVDGCSKCRLSRFCGVCGFSVFRFGRFL